MANEPTFRNESITTTRLNKLRNVKYLKRRRLSSLLLMLPSLLLIVLFSYYPAIRSLIGSMTSWNGFSAPTFVGLQNFVSYIHEPLFLIEIRNIVVLVFGGVITMVVFPFLGAELILGISSKRIQTVFKYLLVIPMVIPPVVLIDIWAKMLSPTNGLVDGVLGLFKIPVVQWFSNPHTALISILLIGFPWISNLSFLIYLAGLQGISTDVKAAAAIDGCVGIKRIIKIDVPLILAQVQFVVVISGVQIVQNFIPILLLTNGGPGNATMVPGLDMYDSAFQSNQLGYGMAIGTLLFIGLLAVTMVVLRVLRPRV